MFALVRNGVNWQMEWPLFFCSGICVVKIDCCRVSYTRMSDRLCDWWIIVLSNRFVLLLQFKLRLDYGQNRWNWVWHKRIQNRNAIIIVVVVYFNTKWNLFIMHQMIIYSKKLAVAFDLFICIVMIAAL